MCPSYNPADAETSTVWAAPVSLAATRGIDCSFFSSAYLDVSVQRVCRLSSYWVVPFGDPRVITAICASTRLFAACHVLRRRRDPRHPPCALLFFLLFSFLTHVRFCLFFLCLSTLVAYICLHMYRLFSLDVNVLYRVENNGFEPLTLCVQGRCSSQLS